MVVHRRTLKSTNRFSSGSVVPPMTDLRPSDRYTVISADGHAGADLWDYKPYLARQ